MIWNSIVLIRKATRQEVSKDDTPHILIHTFSVTAVQKVSRSPLWWRYLDAINFPQHKFIWISYLKWLKALISTLKLFAPHITIIVVVTLPVRSATVTGIEIRFKAKKWHKKGCIWQAFFAAPIWRVSRHILTSTRPCRTEVPLILPMFTSGLSLCSFTKTALLRMLKSFLCTSSSIDHWYVHTKFVFPFNHLVNDNFSGIYNQL